MKPAEKLLAIKTGELEWEDGAKVVGLPRGVEVKMVAEGVVGVSERVDKFVRFPPGRLEPLHTHYHLPARCVA
ncbi:MAG: hypothetical protein V3V56_11440 [bacterium]